MLWQLRIYRAKDGELDAFVEEWREHVLPLRRAHGFDVLGPWVSDDDRFVWIIGHENLQASDEAYYASAERAAISPDPAAVPTATASIMPPKRRSSAPKRGPDRSCHTFVTSEGTSSRAAASAGAMAAPRSPIATVGRPRPMTPLTSPAKRNVAAMSWRCGKRSGMAAP